MCVVLLVKRFVNVQFISKIIKIPLICIKSLKMMLIFIYHQVLNKIKLVVAWGCTQFMRD